MSEPVLLYNRFCPTCGTQLVSERLSSEEQPEVWCQQCKEKQGEIEGQVLQSHIG